MMELTHHLSMKEKREGWFWYESEPESKKPEEKKTTY